MDARGISYPTAGNAACAQVEDGSFWFRHRNLVILDQLRRFPPGGAVWDIGGGNGFVSLALQRAGFETVLVEPGADGARMASERGVRQVFHSTFDEVAPPAGSVPAVGLFDVLEHIEDDARFLRTLHTALAPGGRAYLTVPAFNLLWSSEDVHAGHFRRYTVRSLSRVLRDAGFVVELASPFFQALTLPVFALRAVPSRLGLRREAKLETTAKEHTAPPGVLGRLFARILDAERARLRSGRRLSVGTSLIAVARKSP